MKKRYWALITILVLAAAVFWLTRPEPSTPGREYIHDQARKDPDQLKTSLQEKRRNEIRQELDAGTLEASALLTDYCLVGDSRAEAFRNVGLSDPARTFTTLGTTVKDVDNHLEEVKDLQPGNIILIYGINDLDEGLLDTEGGYGNLYAGYVKKLQEQAPEANIFVSSILPVAQTALYEHPNLTRIDEANGILRSMCEENGWTYLDFSGLPITEEDYDTDGVHFLWTWMPEWYAAIAQDVLEAAA